VGTHSGSPCREVQSHVAEKFWSIHMSYQAPAGPAGGGRCQFEWRRGRLFDHVAATVLYELCCEDPVAHVLRVRFPGPMHGGIYKACASAAEQTTTRLCHVFHRWSKSRALAPHYSTEFMTMEMGCRLPFLVA